MGLRVRDGAGDTRGCGDSGWEAGCPLPENTVVSPLLCGVGFRLLPAFISARSSELSPVGDIMLKDLVLPVEDEERRCPQAAPAPSMGRGGAGGGELRASGSGGGGGGGGSSLDALESAEQPLCTWFPGSSAASSLWAMPGRAASGSPGLRPSWR